MVVCIIGFALFFLSLLFTYLIRQFSIKRNILDVPNQRSLHQLPTPRGGGLAFILTFYLAVFVLWFNHFIHLNILLVLVGGIPIACIGYCDDVFGVKAQWRACVHLFSAVWGLYFLGTTSSLFFIFAIFVTVWFVNLYNFMDGIDGLAGMEAVFVSAAMGLILFLHGFNGSSFVCFALTFSVLGFLVFNWPPAKIFMGDVGSGFLGYIFAMLMWVTNSQHQISPPVWWILLSVFILDASYTLIHRMIQKKKWWLAHREHAYQRLTQSGFSHKKITLGILLINVFICLPLAEIYLNLHQMVRGMFYLMLLSSASWFVWVYLIKKYKIV